jgi:uncharacterized membrane protein
MMVIILLNLSNLILVTEEMLCNIVILEGDEEEDSDSSSSSNKEIIVLRLFTDNPTETQIKTIDKNTKTSIFSEELKENMSESECTTEQESDSDDDPTSNKPDVLVKTRKRISAMYVVTVLIAILLGIVSIFHASTLMKRLILFIPICMISISFGHLTQELPIVCVGLIIFFIFLLKCDPSRL